jgi:putative ABC transport system permease protein
VLRAFERDRVEEGGAWRPLLDLTLSLPGAHLRNVADRRGGVGRELGRDLRIALRRLRHEPLTGGIVVLTVALGVGATTGVFGIAWAVLLRPLPFDQPDRLVRIWGTGPEGDREPIALADALEWRGAPSLAMVAMHDLAGTRLDGDDGLETVGSADVSANFFPLLGVEAERGRLFAPGEDLGPSRSVVVQHGFWTSALGGDPDVVGSELVLDGEPHTVVGVLPADFEDPMGEPDYPVRLYTLFDLDPAGLVRNQHSFQALARLGPGVGPERAQEELDAISADIARRFPESKTGLGVRVEGLREAMVGDAGRALRLLLLSVGLVLVVACANVGSLLLARSTRRRGEVAVRSALGASRPRIVRQLLVESLVLALLGGALGLALAMALDTALLPLMRGRIPRVEGLEPGAPILLFTLGVSLLTALLFGVAPAVQATGADPARTLGEGGRGGTTPRGVRRFLDGLAVAEVAVCVVLLTAAGLVGKSFVRLTGVETGFATDGVLTFRLSHPWRGDEAGRVRALQDRLVARLEALPSVSAAGAVNFLPLSGNWACVPYTAEGVPRPTEGDPCAEFRTATPGYFDAMDIDVVEGRGLRSGDDGAATRVMVVNRTLAERVWPGRSAVGRRLRWGRPDQDGPWWSVVGVAEDVRHFGRAEAPMPEVYMTYAQGGDVSTYFAVRVESGAPDELVPAVREIVREADASILPSDFATVDELLREDAAAPRFRLLLLGSFAVLAMGLGLVGVYGVLAHAAASRRSEIGIRLVLGADGRGVQRRLVARAAGLAFAGVVLGLLAFLLVGRSLERFLFQVDALDPTVLLGAALTLLLTAALAGWAPARRAARTDPAATLRGG